MRGDLDDDMADAFVFLLVGNRFIGDGEDGFELFLGNEGLEDASVVWVPVDAREPL